MLEDLIKEGQDIRGSITHLDTPERVIRLYSAYRNPDTQKYGAWKNRSIRYLDRTFPNDRCVRDFETAIESFEKNHNNPSKFDDAIGVLISCRDFKPAKDATPVSGKTTVKTVLNLEAEYERLVSGKDSENKREAIEAFHNWYDALVRLLSLHYDESDTNFKKIMDADTSGNGYSLHGEYRQIKSNSHILLDKLESGVKMGNVKRTDQRTPVSNKVFIVHGHDVEMKESVARLLEKLGLEPIILSEQPDQNRTIIEKFEEESNVDYAVVLMSDQDDHGCEVTSTDLKPRARQNVILELGYFMGKLGRKGHVCVLKKGDIEEPSDILGVIYKEYRSSDDSWKYQLAREMKSCGYNISLDDI